ncbi:MAG: hypothetical protein K2L94_04545 [Alphaproteobacteria bacterium]|nr:hypothetical protein [Alphaproteobacteria bacterium]
MKKILLVLGIVVVVLLGIFWATRKSATPTPATAQDFAVLSAALNGQPVVATGEDGGALIKMPATPELIDIAGRARTTTFVAVENPAQYAQDGFVLVNIVPASILAQNPEMSSCAYRVFYGTADDMTGDYAVAVCNN